MLISPQLKEGPKPYSLHLGIIPFKLKCIFLSPIIKNVKLYIEKEKCN